MAVRTARMIFYHVPKTGGAWVKVAMRAAGLRLNKCKGTDWHEFDLRRDHAAPSAVCQKHKRGHFSFCYVRHPAEWYRSFWAYRYKSRRFNRRFPADRCWAEDFNEFVDNMLVTFPDGFVTALYGYYVDDVCYVGRQETLADNLVEALRLGGETFDEAALRATPPQNVVAGNPKYGDRCNIDPVMRERIMETEQWVMDRFYPAV